MHFRFRFRFFLFMTALLVLAGCSPQAGQQMPEANSGGVISEELLIAEGRWNMVEEEEGLSPLEQHLRARKQVEPDKLSKSPQYTSKGAAPHEGTHFRVLRLANATGGSGKSRDKKSTGTEKMMPAKSDLIVADLKPASGRREPARAPSGDGVSVTGLRMGDHPGKTRLVLDLTAPSGFSSAVDNTTHTLRIELPSAAWNAETQKDFAGHQLVQGYTAEPLASGGTLVSIALKKPAKVLTSMALEPNEIHGNRIYFDVAAG